MLSRSFQINDAYLGPIGGGGGMEEYMLLEVSYIAEDTNGTFLAVTQIKFPLRSIDKVEPRTLIGKTLQMLIVV